MQIFCLIHNGKIVHRHAEYKRMKRVLDIGVVTKEKFLNGTATVQSCSRKQEVGLNFAHS